MSIQWPDSESTYRAIVDSAIDAAPIQLHEQHHYSWAEIANRLGIGTSTALERWGA